MFNSEKFIPKEGRPEIKEEDSRPLNEEEIKELKILEGPDIKDKENWISFHEWIEASVSIQDRRLMLERLGELQKRRNIELEKITGRKLEETGGLGNYFNSIEEYRRKWDTLSQEKKEELESRSKELTQKANFNFTEKEEGTIGPEELRKYSYRLSEQKRL